jgi:hypothetical protein
LQSRSAGFIRRCRARGGRHHRFDDVAITPQPLQRPIPAYVASFSQRSVALYHRTCAKHGRAPGRLMCSYFIHFADTEREQETARAR